MYYILYIIYYVLNTIHYILHIIYYVLYITYYILCIIYVHYTYEKTIEELKYLGKKIVGITTFISSIRV